MATDPTREEAEAYARQRAREYGVDEDLIVRQIGMESSWNPRAVSPAGARGYMQLMPGTAGDLGVDPDDWRQNIDGGVRYMSQQIDAFGGDLELAAAAYNSGPGNARRRGKDWSQYRPETQNYVRNLVGGGQDPAAAGGQPAGQGSTVTIDGVEYEGATFDWGLAEASPEEKRAAGYQQAADGTWFRFAPNSFEAEPAAPMDVTYQRRADAREDAVLDQQQADLEARIEAQKPDAPRRSWLTELFGGGAAQAATGADALILGESGAELNRSMGERFLENIDDAFQRSGAGYLSRMMDPNANGFDLADIWHQPEIIEGKPMDWLLDRVVGENRGYFRSVGPEDRADAPAIAAERDRQARYDDRAARDPVANAGDAAAAIAGQIGGSAVSPENWVAPGRSLLGKIFGNAGAAGGTDALLQGAEIATGTRDDYSMAQTAGSAAVGGALPAAHAVVQRAVVARRAQARARGLQADPVLTREQVTTQGEAVQAEVNAALGNPEGPLLRTRRQSVTPDEAMGPGENIFDINLARINTPDDVRAVITGMADRLSKDADLARRAQQSWDQTREASGKVDWVQSMATRTRGQAMNAEEILAYRQALNASATQLLDLARAAASPDASLAQQYAFRRATSVHAAIQNEFMGARAEAGRALQSFRIPAETPAQYLRQIDSLIADAGSNGTARELASRVLKAAEKGDAAMNETLRLGWNARTREMVKLVYTNSLLSGVGTPIINVAGNTMMLGMNLVSRSISPRLAQSFGGQNVTKVGEASAMAHGYVQAMRDAFRLTPGEALAAAGEQGGLVQQGLFRGMAPGLDDAAPRGIDLRAEREEAGMRVSRPLGAAAWGVSEDSALGRTLDVIQMLAEAPSNFNQLTDDFFKIVAARGEMHARVHRAVTNEGLQGEAARARYAELIQNPTDEMLEAAEREMHELTFTRETPGIAQGMSDVRRAMDSAGPIPLGTITMPFLRTPANLISTGMQYSPLAKFSRRFNDALKEGGEAAEIAKAKVALGSMLWAVWINMALDGDITGGGPANRAQREAMMRADENGRQMFQPYSFRVGDRWFSFERLDPLGQMMGLIGDTADLFKAGDWDSDRNVEIDEIIVHAVQAIGSAFFDKTTLRGVVEAALALLGDQVDGERYLQARASAMIPGSSLLRMGRRGEDEYLREVSSAVDAMKNTIPGLSDDLPLQRDLWGRPRTYETGLGTVYDAITPVQTRRIGGNVIDMEILDNGVSIQMPNRSIDVNRERVSLRNRPDIYSEYVRQAGEPAFEHLEAVVTGNHPDSEYYLSLPPGPGSDSDEVFDRGDYIKDVVEGYRRDARLIIMDLYGDELGQMATERIRRREEVRLDR